MATEKRLIDANDLRTQFDDIPPYIGLAGSLVQQYIDNAQTVDAVEVVHGEWNTIEDDYCGLVALQCSVCNAQWWFEDDVSFWNYHYCPKCGAKMDGERKDNGTD